MTAGASSRRSTAGGNATYPSEVGSSRALKNAGAKNVVVLHTTDKRLADTDSFVAPLKRADDAIDLDSTKLSIDAVVAAMKAKINARINAAKDLKRA